MSAKGAKKQPSNKHAAASNAAADLLASALKTKQAVKPKKHAAAKSDSAKQPRRRHGVPSLTRYIHKVLKQVHPDCTITSRAMAEVNNMLSDLGARIGLEASNIARMNKKQTVSGQAVMTAVRLILKGELAKHSVSEISKAMAKYANSEAGTKGKSKSVRSRIGMVFPVGKLMRGMLSHSARVGKKAMIALAITLEYITAEVLELSGNAARDNKSPRIKPRFLQLALNQDEELKGLFANGTIASGGVMPHIDAALLPAKKVHHEKPKTHSNKKPAASKKPSAKKPSKKTAKTVKA